MVELAEHKQTGLKFAVKKIDKASLVNKKIKETLLREIKIHSQLRHENIVRLYTSLEDKDFIYLVLEYCDKGNLFHYIRKKKTLSEEESFFFFAQAAAGIYFLHKNGFIHRDIKPENLLLNSDGVLKVCDFGWCIGIEQDEQRNTFCGTLEYMAPEMIQNEYHDHTLDVWSLGILLFELFHGNAPFTGPNPKAIGQKILGRNIKFKKTATKEFRDLVESIL